MKAKRKFEIPPAVELSDEEARMFQKQDFIGLSYHRCEEIRRLGDRNEEQEKTLFEHDEEEKFITSDPRAALRKAHEALDYGSTILLKMIRSGILRSENHYTDGTLYDVTDEALECLASRISYLNRQLIRLADENAPDGCRHLWFQSKSLTEAFLRLALLHPEEFQPFAETSLTMPSLRSKSPKFTVDAGAIAAAIKLAGKHPAPDISDNRIRAGAECHRLIAEIFDQIFWYRREYESASRSWQIMQNFSETREQYEGCTIEEFLLMRHMHPTRVQKLLRCASLPEWPKGPKEWWNDGVLPEVREEFQRLSMDSTLRPALWSELKKGGERETQNDMRRYMEKLCHNKFQQILKARKTSRP